MFLYISFITNNNKLLVKDCFINKLEEVSEKLISANVNMEDVKCINIKIVGTGGKENGKG